MKKLLLVILTFFVGVLIVSANEELAQNSTSAILIDSLSGKVLYEKNADEKLSPASMTKIMTMLLIMEALDTGKININDKVTISADAAKMGGSQIFLQAGEVYKVGELLKGVAIASGNDASVALAEKISGTTIKFVELMNKRSKEIGCKNTNFVNSHGLDDENHYSTARDMALLAKELLKYEKILNYTSIYEEYLTKNDGSKTWLVNTNKLVRFYPGVDGLKTGFTDKAGYCLTATALKNQLRLISVIMKSPTSETRNAETAKLLNYGFNSYKLTMIRDKNKSLGRIKIFNSKDEYINVYLEKHAVELQNINDDNKIYNFKIILDKVKAPIKKGDVIGKVNVIDNNGKVVDTLNLTVINDVEKANFGDYIKRNINIVSGGKILKV